MTHIEDWIALIVILGILFFIYRKYKDKVLEKLHLLPLGVQRLIYLGTIIPVLLCTWIAPEIDEGILYGVLFGVPAYIILVLVGIWVYEGFKENKS